MLRALVLPFILAAAGCGAGVEPAANAPVEGLLTAEWTGTHRGSFRALATARWCAGDTLIEILAARSDTGVALAVMGTDSVAPGPYPVYAPRVFTAWRPQSSVVARWLGKTELLGFEGIGGQVVVTETGEKLTGRIEASLRIHLEGRADTLHLTGDFTRIPIRPATPPCGRSHKPAA